MGDPFLEIAAILAVATAVGAVMQLFRLPLLLGHMLTGVIVGPAAFHVIRSEETLHIFSQLGIAALLFIVGLGLSPYVLREVGKIALLTGLGQILFTTLFGFLLNLLLGLPWLPALLVAVALTFSSTIIIMKLLADRGDLGKLYGKISIGFLLVQDLVATLILIGVATLSPGKSAGQAVFFLIVKMVLIVGAALLASRFLLPRLTRLFASSQEFLFLFSIGWGVGMGALFRILGLSVEIGALVAGVTLAASPYRYEITAKMRLIRDFFLIMFFVLLGSQLSWGNLESLWLKVAILSFFILIGNPLIVMVIMGISGYSKKTSFFSGLTVAQISEFSLIFTILAFERGYVSQENLSLVTLVGIVTITASVFMILKADALYRLLAPLLGIFERRHPIAEHAKKERYDAILFGCHRVGRDFIPTFNKLGLTFLVVDFDPRVVQELEQQGIPCRYGDVYDSEFLDEIEAHRAKIIVSTVPDDETNAFILSSMRKTNPRALILLRAQSTEQAKKLYQGGADYVIAPHFLGGNHTAMLLERHGYSKRHFQGERSHHLRHLDERNRPMTDIERTLNRSVNA